MDLKNWTKLFQEQIRSNPLVKKIQPWLWPIALAILGTTLLFSSIHRYKAELGYYMPTTQVLVSAQELTEGHTLREGDLVEKRIPKELLPAGALLGSDAPKVIGLSMIRPSSKGNIMFWADLDTTYLPTVPAKRITKGYRAISINVSEVSSVAYSIRPGDHVDLFTILNLSGSEHPTSMTLLQNVTVLDVGNNEKFQDGDHFSVISLMVLPKEVPLILLAADQGKLMLALRNPEDIKVPRDLPVTDTSQMIEAAFRNSIQDERNHSEVEIIRGGHASFEP